MSSLMTQVGNFIRDRLLSAKSPITAASPDLDMSFNQKVVPVDTSSNSVDFQIDDGVIKAGLRCIIEVKDGTNNISFTRTGSTATINGGTSKSYTTPSAYTHIHVTCGEDDELTVTSST
jgi:hypothetical protein